MDFQAKDEAVTLWRMRSVKTPSNRPLLNDWKILGEIKPGDRLAVHPDRPDCQFLQWNGASWNFVKEDT